MKEMIGTRKSGPCRNYLKNDSKRPSCCVPDQVRIGNFLLGHTLLLPDQVLIIHRACLISFLLGKWLSFNNYARKERLPFVVYADLECELIKTEEAKSYQHHKVFSVAYYIHCSYDDSLSAYNFRRSADCVAWFAEELKNLAIRVKT